MTVLLEGSCHCGAVRFTVESHTPIPYQLCMCSICRKVGGVGGSINLAAITDTLQITQGKEHIRVYHAVLDRDTPEERIAPDSDRNFCVRCSSMLWVYSPSWPELIHPFASAIDSPLEPPEEMVVLMTDSKPDYVRIPEGAKKLYKNYSPDSIEEWHEKHAKYVE